MVSKKHFLLFLTLFFALSGYAQNNIENALLKAYSSKDSSYYLFNKTFKNLRSKSDTASYLYFKFFKKDIENQNDSANYYAKKLIPLFHELDTLKRLRKVHERLYYQNLKNGNYDNALREIQTTLDIAIKLKDTSYISLHYSDISVLQHDYNLFKQGVEYGKKAYHIMSIAKKKDYKYLIIANNAIAINFDDWNKPDSALFYHYKNVDLLKKVKDTIRYGFVYNNIANTNLKVKNYARAKEFLKKSLAINLIRNRNYNLSTNYNNLATIAYKENNYSQAKEYFKKAASYAQKSNSIEKIRDVLEQEYLFYKKIKDYKKALQKKDSFYTLYDSVFKIERSSKFSKLEIEYQTAKKEKEIAQQKEQLLASELKIKNRNLYAILITSALLILIIISYALYKKQQYKRKQLQREIHLKDALAKIQTQNRLQEQRLRISRDLHDNIGSQLTFIISSIDNLKYITKDANDQLKNKLTSISSFTSDTIFQLRDTIWAMNKSEITIEDLQTRIMSFIEKAKTASENINFNVNVNVDNKIRFTSVNGIHIFRIIQEAINNSIKYSDASNISITIKENKNSISFSISDNGKGFEKNEVSLGNGLKNIQKRIEEIGGKLKISSTKEEGTKVSFNITK